MPPRLRWMVALLVFSLHAVAAAPSPLVFEVSFPRELSAGKVDGRLLLILSKDEKKEPHLEDGQAHGRHRSGWGGCEELEVLSKTRGEPGMQSRHARTREVGIYFVPGSNR